MSARRLSRRAVFAQVLLAASPSTLMPQSEIAIRIVFDTVAELKQWLADSGLTAAEPDMLQAERTSTALDGRTYHSMDAYPKDFHGWEVYAEAREYADLDPLDDPTRDQLRKIAATPAYERENPVTNGPLPDGVEGRPLGRHAINNGGAG